MSGKSIQASLEDEIESSNLENGPRSPSQRSPAPHLHQSSTTTNEAATIRSRSRVEVNGNEQLSRRSILGRFNRLTKRFKRNSWILKIGRRRQNSKPGLHRTNSPSNAGASKSKSPCYTSFYPLLNNTRDGISTIKPSYKIRSECQML